MATKRKITVKVPPPEVEETEDRLKPVVMRRDPGWRGWFLGDYLRYWYFIGCLMVDAFILLQVWQMVEPGLSVSVPIIILVAMVIAEALLYLALWGRDGRWKKT